MKSGDLVEATGVLLGSKLAVDSSSVLATATTQACSTKGVQNTAVLLVTFPGMTPTLTPQALSNQLLSDAVSAASAQGVNIQNYSRVFVVFPDLSPSCGFRECLPSAALPNLRRPDLSPRPSPTSSVDT